jgi:hypothetical protein
VSHQHLAPNDGVFLYNGDTIRYHEAEKLLLSSDIIAIETSQHRHYSYICGDAICVKKTYYAPAVTHRT